MDNNTFGFDEVLMSDVFESDAEFIPIVTDEDEQNVSAFEVPDILPILPLRNTVLFPGVIIPISIGREKSLTLIKEIQKSKGVFGAVAQKDIKVDDPQKEDLYDIGTVAKVIKVLEMPDNSTSVIIQGKKRFQIEEMITDEPYHMAKVKGLEDEKDEKQKNEFEAVVSSIKDLSLRVIKASSNVPPEASFAVKNIENDAFLINFVCSNSDISVGEKQRLLAENKLFDRGMLLLEHLAKEVQMQELKSDIQSKVKLDIDQQQREYMLQQQIKTIQDELGSSPIEQEIRELKEKATKKKWSKEVKDLFKKELDKLQRLNPAAGEYSVQHNYLQTLIDLPWNEYTKDNYDMNRAERILDRDHYGLDKVKERILEHLAVLKLKGELKSPIICLYGPPGVGKTSLGKSIAESLGRKYVRMSLGGVHDEAEIRGHRKTYIGAMPGRIIQSIKKAGAANPVFILDEIDKVNASAHGDPSAALLEVLDPEQNEHFHDNFLEVDFDLSKTMFVATANTLGNISQPLLDRMELINVSGYILDEKTEIAKRHLLPKQMENHGIPKGTISVSKKVMAHIVESYTRESGVRELDKILAKLCRKIALKIAKGDELKKTITIKDVAEYLGVVRFSKDKWQDNTTAGVVTGLAWTAVGGEILFVETSLSKGKGKLTLTGNLGDVMKESALLAVEYLRANADKLGIKHETFDEWNVHVHVPEGAIPKDGPSAGVTMVTSLASAFTQRKVRARLAMTGEITLRGKVLPVGGIKEKILAAKRAGITDIILSQENQKDIEEINNIYLEGLEFHFVKDVSEVLRFALLDEKVKNPLKI
ncbi:endopeptidase La [Carboxylicivirga mesophila]|uniref:Lon protease n=1 Tax=Carboxylicivirga mesophila TaxID=1166478 RepID=A0ABS5K6Q4_9BACT|nr:endopeptidase La [Carboxylicivirga mesophila]MBS2210665.1 endopeptidase La [Carboxylicivirga mesophila]